MRRLRREWLGVMVVMSRMVGDGGRASIRPAS